MPKFRKKPVLVEARQFTQNTLEAHAATNWCNGRRKTGILLIDTLEGTMSATYGDWIIKGVNGEFYPCKPDIFEKTYEEVPDA